MKSCKCGDHRGSSRGSFLYMQSIKPFSHKCCSYRRLARSSFDLSAKEVLEFCTECVLNDDEDSQCEIPEAFYGELTP